MLDHRVEHLGGDDDRAAHGADDLGAACDGWPFSFSMCGIAEREQAKELSLARFSAAMPWCEGTGFVRRVGPWSWCQPEADVSRIRAGYLRDSTPSSSARSYLDRPPQTP
jgi:hypothetical protein